MTGPTRRHTVSSRPPVIWLSVWSLLLVAAACGSTDTEVVAGPGDLGHIHDLAFDDDGSLLVASHLGLYRIEDVDRAVLVGSARHDLMAMTRLEAGDLVASGHPDLRGDEYRVDGLPPHFGLIESDDLGKSWAVMGGLGEADFHALAPTDEGIYAAESTTASIWLLAPGGDWEQRGAIEASDLAADPADPQRQIATGYEGGLWTSTDGAMNWQQEPDSPLLIEVEWLESGQLFGIEETGIIWASPLLDSEWTPIASGPDEPETLLVLDPSTWWVTSHGGQISRTENAGADWIDVYVPPTGE